VKKRYTFTAKKQNKNGFKDPCRKAKLFLGLLSLLNKTVLYEATQHAASTPENAPSGKTTTANCWLIKKVGRTCSIKGYRNLRYR
jgi:hypothetical protein